ncbi:MAG: YbaB/EbfC family nucleoid-associated protein [Proteobacteria bacterium]|nr:YbaB/EbfC family nucleoid-associated protein [Pseudomonadota bacterium]
MKNIGQMMKQAQALQTKMQEFQENLVNIKVDGASGAGLVKMTVNGKGNIVSLKIDPSLLKADEGEILEDLIIAAYSDAKEKVEDFIAKEMDTMSGGMGNFKLPF